MAYGDNVLGASHKWTLNNELIDTIGSLTLANIGGGFITTPITRDSAHSYRTTGRDNRLEAAGATTTNLADQERYAVGGWFMASQVQGPPCMIYKQGGTTNNFAIFLWAGNNVMFQNTTNTGEVRQIFSNFALTDNRPYHFLIQFSGSNFDNKFSAYIDGVEQTATADGQTPNLVSMPTHTSPLNWGESGSTGLDINIGNSTTVLVKAPVNGFWSQWWSWNNISLSDNDIRELIFAPGAIPQITITSGTQANMQSQLDALGNIDLSDIALSILVEEVIGGGDLNLSTNNQITFNNRSSIHIRYEGAGNLNWTNLNSSNASLPSGNVNIFNPATLTIDGLVIGTEVRIYDNDGVDNNDLGTELAGIEFNNSSQFQFSHSGIINQITIQLIRGGYFEILQNIDLTNVNQTFSFIQELDNNT